MPKTQEQLFGDVQDVRYAKNAGAVVWRCTGCTVRQKRRSSCLAMYKVTTLQGGWLSQGCRSKSR